MCFNDLSSSNANVTLGKSMTKYQFLMLSVFKHNLLARSQLVNSAKVGVGVEVKAKLGKNTYFTKYVLVKSG